MNVSKPTIVTVTDNHGQPVAGVPVYAFDGAAYTNISVATNTSGQAAFRLPFGAYRFRADVNGVQLWSGEANHCAAPGCETTEIVASFVAVTVTDGLGVPLAGVAVYAFDGTAYTNYSKTTDAAGVALFTLPAGSYRFRADVNGAQIWSGEANHCTTPACDAAGISAPFVTVTVADGLGVPLSGISVYAFDDGAYTGHTKTTDAAGQAVFTLPAGDYAFRADVDGVQLWSGAGDHCELPACTATTVIAHFITVSVLDGAAAAVADVPIYLFDGETYLNQTRTTDAAGQATFVVPAGSYRFRADLGGTHLWSGEANHCATPGCLAATILAPRVSVTVLDQDAGPLAGVAVYAFSGGEYQNLSTVTDANGVAEFVLPAGAYRFRADAGGTQLWSGASDDCLVPVCAAASITAHFVTVSVQDQAALPLANVPVYLFSGVTYLDLSGNTDETGQAVFVLPEGAFRFRVDVGGTQLWSSLTDDCATPGCTTVSLTAHFVTVLVESTGGTRHAGVPVYLFDGETYLDKSAVTDAEGAALFVLPAGEYRFRADLFEVPFWSGEANDCLIPGCLDVTVLVPGAEGVGGYVARTIDYVYDPLNRLIEANYDDATYFHYVYDPVGNRLTEETQIGATSYAYDVANRLTSGAGQSYTWDDNGNLLDDGASSYTYDKANQLVGVQQGGTIYVYEYNGMGDRLTQTENGVTANYTLDLAAHLTEVLADGQSTFVSGLGRIGEQRSAVGLPGSLTGEQDAIWLYHLSDAIGSVRQVAGPGALVVFAQSYEPYGDVLSSAGIVESQYGFAGEWLDSTGNIYLRARYYSSSTGRFNSKDPWSGDTTFPLSLNPWLYAYADPIYYTDPTGEAPCDRLPQEDKAACLGAIGSARRAITFSTQGRYWTTRDIQAVYEGVEATTVAFMKLLNHMGYNPMTGRDIFTTIFGRLAFHASGITTGYYCERYFLEPNGVICYANSANDIDGPLVAHELGHVYNASFANQFQGVQTPYNELGSGAGIAALTYLGDDGNPARLIEYRPMEVEVDWTIDGKPVIGIKKNGSPIIGKTGETPIKRTVTETQLWRDYRVGQSLFFSRRYMVGEEFADLFANWVYGGFQLDTPAGVVRHSWINNRLQSDMTRFFGLPPNPNPLNPDC